jgi:hypothetical protein
MLRSASALSGATLTPWTSVIEGVNIQGDGEDAGRPFLHCLNFRFALLNLWGANLRSADLKKYSPRLSSQAIVRRDLTYTSC